jgi:FHS family glucose/mannose:H+ symporter-like MFS transporter
MEKFAADSSIREWISGFVLVGLLLGLVGPLLIAWQYHIHTDPQLIGLHFLGLNAGYVVALGLAQRLLRRVSIRSLAMTGCVTGFASLLGLSFLIPPVLPAWRIAVLALAGFAGGSLTTALLYALEPYFAKAPAAIANRAGAFFGGGCLISALIVAATYFAGSVQIETALLALIPLIYLVLYAASRCPPALKPVPERERQSADSLHDLRKVAVILLSVLLFFQFGNEWAIAGWLPLFLIHRLGINPVWALFALALYFLALMSGRLAASRLLRFMSHRKLLVSASGLAMSGCVLLSFSTSTAVAWVAVPMIGAGFAPVYPVLAESLDQRFFYRPGFYNGTCSIAITGAMCAPWLLGYVDQFLGIQFVMLLPALGSVIVLAAALLMMLEAHLMGDRQQAPPQGEPKQKRMTAASGKG